MKRSALILGITATLAAALAGCGASENAPLEKQSQDATVYRPGPTPTSYQPPPPCTECGMPDAIPLGSFGGPWFQGDQAGIVVQPDPNNPEGIIAYGVDVTDGRVTYAVTASRSDYGRIQYYSSNELVTRPVGSSIGLGLSAPPPPPGTNPHGHLGQLLNLVTNTFSQANQP
jgi:hypothetical protein